MNKELTKILEEFAGKVKYYDIPKDLAAWTYKESDIERARNKIISHFDSLLSRRVEEIEKLNLDEFKEFDDGSRVRQQDRIGYNQGISDAIKTLKGTSN